MTNDLAGLVPALRATAEPLVLGFPRVLAMLSITPLLPSNVFPATLRNGIAIALLLPLYPMLRAGVADAPEDAFHWTVYVAKEVAIGAAIGWSFGIILWSFESVGGLLDIQTGTATGATFDPLSQQQSAVYAQLMRHLASTLFIGAGGLLAMVNVLYDSFHVWPVQAALPLSAASVWELGRISSTQMLSAALAVALPFIVLLLVLELGLGLLNRSLPQLNVFQLAMPVKMLGALCMLGLALGYLGDLVGQFLARHHSLAGLGLGALK